MSIRDLDYLFAPRSVAIIGASNRAQSVGHVLARNLLQGGFEGPIMPVNPRHRSVAGVYAWPDVESLPTTPDLAVIATPADQVVAVVAALAQRGTKACAIISAGFGEGGDAEGSNRRQQLYAAAGSMRILGPNILGLMVPGIGLNASFAHRDPLPGDLAFLSQSGAMLTTVLDWASSRQIGFSHAVSLGDMADVDFGDMLNYLAGDPKVRAILLYMESLSHAPKFMSAARAAARTKPVVVVKSGRHAEGARAAASHTGALAGHDGVYDAAFRRAGMLRVGDTQELFDAVETLSSDLRIGERLLDSHLLPVMGDRLAILTNGGGIGVLATDRLIDHGGRLAQLTPETIASLNSHLPANWSGANPVDIIGDAPGARYRAALGALLDDPGVDAVLVINCPVAIADSTEAAQAVLDELAADLPIEQQLRRRKPVLTSWVGDRSALAARQMFRQARIPTYNTAEEAVRAFMHIVGYARNQALLLQVPGADDEAAPISADARAATQAIIADAMAQGHEWLNEQQAKQILAHYGIAIARTDSAATPEEAYALAKSHGDRLQAVKILSPDITHKSDVGGVILNLATPEQVADATRDMIARIKRSHPQCRIDGVTIQDMVQQPGNHELIVGITRDPLFGPVLLFGKGGKEVEIVGDTAMALPPLDHRLAEALIAQTAVAKLLRGYRDRPAIHFRALQQALLAISQLAIDHPLIAELDINPLIADEQGVIALDARIRLLPLPESAHGQAMLAIQPYPRQWEKTLELRDGRQIALRPIRPSDAELLKELVVRSNPEDIRFRFLHPMKRLPHQLAARLSQIDYAREMAFAAFDPSKDDGLVGVARLSADPDGQEAEYSILLRGDFKRVGLGFAMMQHLLCYAKSKGLSRIYGEVLAENQPMLAMCREFGFTMQPDRDDTSLVHVSLDLLRPDLQPLLAG